MTHFDGHLKSRGHRTGAPKQSIGPTAIGQARYGPNSFPKGAIADLYLGCESVVDWISSLPRINDAKSDNLSKTLTISKKTMEPNGLMFHF